MDDFEVKELPELPIEMWMEVIRNVPNKLELSLVSKTFYEAVKSIRYNNIFAYIYWIDIESSIENVEEKVQNQSELNIQLKSPNFSTLDFLKKHGNRIKALKIDGKCKLNDYLDILSLVPNCESLDIAKIEFEENSYQNADGNITMVKLNDLHISVCDETSDIFWRCFNSAALNKLTVEFKLQNFRKLDEICDKNHQLKVLELNEIEKQQAAEKFIEIELNSLKYITLETVIIKRKSYTGNLNKFLLAILKTQPDLKILQIHRVGKIDINVVCNYAPKLETLKLEAFKDSVENLMKITNLANLKRLSLVYYLSTAHIEPEFYIKLSKSNLRHLELGYGVLKRTSPSSSLLSYLTQLESLKLIGIRWIPYIEVNIPNINLKSLKTDVCIPLKLFKKFIFCYPNLENLDMRLLIIKDKSDGAEEPKEKLQKINSRKIMLDLIKEAKEERFFAVDYLVNAVIMVQNVFNSKDFLRLQLTLIQLAWPNLKSLKLIAQENYKSIENEIKDLINEKTDLQLLEIRCYIKNFNEDEMCKKFPGKFDRITYENKILSFKKIKEGEVKSEMKSIMIKNYSKYDTILNDERIRSLELFFDDKTAENEQEFEYFVKLIENFKERILKMHFIGKLKGDQITRLLMFASKCEHLYLDEFIFLSDLTTEISLQNLKILRIKNEESIGLLKFLKIPNLHMLVIPNIEHEEFCKLQEFLKNRTNLTHFVQDTKYSILTRKKYEIKGELSIENFSE